MGDDSFYTCLPSKLESLGNLSKAIDNIRDMQENIVRTNRDARVLGGYYTNQILDVVANIFKGNSLLT